MHFKCIVHCACHVQYIMGTRRAYTMHLKCTIQMNHVPIMHGTMHAMHSTKCVHVVVHLGGSQGQREPSEHDWRLPHGLSAIFVPPRQSLATRVIHVIHGRTVVARCRAPRRFAVASCEPSEGPGNHHQVRWHFLWPATSNPLIGKLPSRQKPRPQASIPYHP